MPPAVTVISGGAGPSKGRCPEGVGSTGEALPHAILLTSINATMQERTGIERRRRERLDYFRLTNGWLYAVVNLREIRAIPSMVRELLLQDLAMSGK